MRNLRLAFNNMNGEREDITLPMEKWIVDWWFECNLVPENDTVISIAELDGASILSNAKAKNEEYVIFEDIAYYLGWDGLHNDFIGGMTSGSCFNNDSNDFEKWLLENVKTEKEITMEYNVDTDMYKCDFCGFENKWDDSDDEHGELWGCEECGRTFCSKCFIDKYGRKKYMNMMQGFNNICCPICWEKQKDGEMEVEK